VREVDHGKALGQESLLTQRIAVVRRHRSINALPRYGTVTAQQRAGRRNGSRAHEVA